MHAADTQAAAAAGTAALYEGKYFVSCLPHLRFHCQRVSHLRVIKIKDSQTRATFNILLLIYVSVYVCIDGLIDRWVDGINLNKDPPTFTDFPDDPFPSCRYQLKMSV